MSKTPPNSDPCFDRARAEIFDELSSGWDERVARPDAGTLAGLIDLLHIDGKTVLDIGAGTGVLLEAVVEHRPTRWIACDISERMLEILKRKYARRVPSLELLVADAHALPLDDSSVDIAVCNGVFPHFADGRRALSEIHRVLIPGGVVAINHFAGRDTINHVHRSSQSELLRQDLLIPMAELQSLLAETGFHVESTTDEPDLYRAIATAQKGGAESRPLFGSPARLGEDH